MDTQKAPIKKPPVKAKAEVVDITAEHTDRSVKGYVEVEMQLFKRPEDVQAQAWTLKGNSLVQINGKARKLCKENGRRFPSDVEVWEVIQ